MIGKKGKTLPCQKEHCFILALAATFSASDLRPNKLIDWTSKPPTPYLGLFLQPPPPPVESGQCVLTWTVRQWEASTAVGDKLWLSPKTAAGGCVFGLRTSPVLSFLLAHMQSISIDSQCDGARHSVFWHSEFKKQSWRESRVALDDLGLPQMLIL